MWTQVPGASEAVCSLHQMPSSTRNNEMHPSTPLVANLRDLLSLMGVGGWTDSHLPPSQVPSGPRIFLTDPIVLFGD